VRACPPPAPGRYAARPEKAPNLSDRKAFRGSIGPVMTAGFPPALMGATIPRQRRDRVRDPVYPVSCHNAKRPLFLRPPHNPKPEGQTARPAFGAEVGKSYPLLR